MARLALGWGAVGERAVAAHRVIGCFDVLEDRGGSVGPGLKPVFCVCESECFSGIRARHTSRMGRPCASLKGLPKFQPTQREESLHAPLIH